MNHDFVNRLPLELKTLAHALSGETELTNDIWIQGARSIRSSRRSEVYSWLDDIQFTDSFLYPASLFSPLSHKQFWKIDERLRVVRQPREGIPDDVYLPNGNLTDVLEEDNTTNHKYGVLRQDIRSGAKSGKPSARISETFYNLAVYQANQIKFPLERFLTCLMIAYQHGISEGALQADKQRDDPDPADNPALSALRQLLRHFQEHGQYKPPFLKTSKGVVFCLYEDRRPLSAQVPPLLIDLVNYAIMIYACDIDRDISVPTVRMMIKASGTPSYNHTQLKLKKVIPAASLYTIYENGCSGTVPIINWEEPRPDYRFRLDGIRPIPNKWKNDLPGATELRKKGENLAKEYAMESEFHAIRKIFSQMSEHGHSSMKMLRDALAGVSSLFITRSPTDTVLQEYTHAPVIRRPIPEGDWKNPVGAVRYLKADAQHDVARSLYGVWKEAAIHVANDPKMWDPNEQAILRSQYVTPRGGSGHSVKKSLSDSGYTLKAFSKSGAKGSTKIVQAAQLADVPFSVYRDAIFAPVSHGVRIQVQRRSRTIMPLSIPQQQVSAPHTLCANYINKKMNLSTTSGSNVTEKVVPLGMYASTPPTRSVNIDIKACDSSITYSFFLSLICGAMHEGFEGVNADRPFLGVPSTTVDDGSDMGLSGVRTISGMQTCVQWLSRLYQQGFEYEVKDAFSPGNAFIHDTTTFPSGSTATSTEHTANNSSMMNIFLRQWLPSHTDNNDVLHLASKLDIRRNYICQGDDGLLVIPSMDGRAMDADVIATLLEKLEEFGLESGWQFDIEFAGNTEYLKLLFINGCRIPNAGRHPVVGKERASREQDVIWPGGIDAFIGMFNNGLDDKFVWRRWLKFCWSVACFLSSKVVETSRGPSVIQYPIWSFVYLGMPPVRVLDADPWTTSVYMPSGDLGFYAIIKNHATTFRKRMETNGYQLENTEREVSKAFPAFDFVKFLNDEQILPGYYMAQVQRTPDKSERKKANDEARLMIDQLDRYLFEDPMLRIRVNYGNAQLNSYSGKLPRKMPSLEDVPRRWFDSAVEADVATPMEIALMDTHLLRAQTTRYRGFSKVLEAYLMVDWEFTSTKSPPPAMDLHTPLNAGTDEFNSDHFYKFHGLGPMMESTRTYFAGTLFIARSVSGLDSESIDQTLLRMKAMNVPIEVISGFLMTCGLSKGEASAIATKINFQDMKTVQIAKVTGLNISDKWMTLNFDRLLHDYVDVRTYVSDAHEMIRMPGKAGWLRAVFRFLGAAVVMTRVGPPQPVGIRSIRGGAQRLYHRFLTWMRSV
nr:core RNA-dependent RNA polymerase [Largemouth bass reovirus]